jgi:DNA-binding LytR/AlgR family response regulator
MNGRQMADAARVQRPSLNVLFVFGYAEASVLEEGQLWQGVAVLSKPFSIEAIAEGVRPMIQA